MTVAVDDVDEVAVERACKGDRTVSLNRAEMAAAIAECTRRRLSDGETAELLGVTIRTVLRVRHGETSLPYTRPGATVDTTKEKIAEALKSESTQVRRAAQRANAALAALDTALHEWGSKEAARERVAELEAQLAAAKAALRKPVKRKPVSAPGEQAAARAWARQQGIPVNDIGRVPASVMEQWRQAEAVA